MRQKKIRAIISVVVLALFGCEKDKAITPAITPSCILQSETTSMVGNEATWSYEYDDKGAPSTVSKTNAWGGLTAEFLIDHFGVTRTTPQNSAGTTKRDYRNTSIMDGLPSSSYTWITLPGETIERLSYQHDFDYDSKGRLIKVKEFAFRSMMELDYLYDLNIQYDDHDNVTQLEYETMTGTRSLIVIPVSAYDDKPSPYIGVKGFRFLLINFKWDNYDPGYIIQALSAHNPLAYTYNNASFTMTYTYNEHGFPISCAKSIDGKHRYGQTFNYTCK